MLAVRLPAELEAELEKVAKATNRSKSYYIRKALAKFLEDREDYLAAIEVLQQKNPRFSFEQVRKECGLDS